MFERKWILSLVVTFCIITSAYATDPNVFQTKVNSNSYMIQGHPAVIGQFPYFVWLDVKIKSDTKFCGGSLISNVWIVTAANCIKDATRIGVHMGMRRIWNIKEWGYRIVNIEPPKINVSDHIYWHPKYQSLFHLNDIGLIRLPPPAVEFSDVIQPVSLACESSIKLDVIAMGQGKTGVKNEKGFPWALQYARMKTISKNRCFIFLPIVAFRKGIICAEGEQRQSICRGDAGGPLIDAKTNELVGIASFGSSIFGCKFGVPQAFQAVPQYLRWIKEVTGIGCKKNDL